MRNEAAGIVERGLKEDLYFAAARALDPGTEQHIGLPYLIGEFSFVLFVSDGLIEEQLTFAESAGAQKTVARGGRQVMVIAGESELIEQRSAGAMRVFTLEPFDERGGFRSDGARLTAVPARFGGQRGESVAAIAQVHSSKVSTETWRRVECGMS